MKDWHALIAAMVAFYGYYRLPLSERSWFYYIAVGVLVITLVAWHWPFVRSTAGHLACAICAVEATQHSLCGLARWGQVATGEDLCRVAFGSDMYHAIVSLALSAAITWGVRRWRR